MVGLKLKYPIHYVVADSNYRNPILKRLLNYIEAIPKTKGMSDMESVRKMMAIRSHGGVICLFAEGRRTWDGRSLPAIYSTTKLIKLLRIPVIVPKLDGVYLSNPCWAPSSRRGIVRIDYQRLFDGPELRSMSTDEIYEKLQQALDHDEYASQRNRMQLYPGRHRAHYLERVLHTCASCETTGSLRSKGHTLRCEACGMALSVDRYGFFVPAKSARRGSRTDRRSAPPPFSTPTDWNAWQIRKMTDRIAQIAVEDVTTPFIRDAGVQMAVGSRSNPLACAGTGTLTLYRDRIEFLCRRPSRKFHHGAGKLATAEYSERGGVPLFVFPISRIAAWNVQNHEHLEWYLGNTLFRFHRPDLRLSGYKWYSTINIVLGRHPQAAHTSPSGIESS